MDSNKKSKTSKVNTKEDKKFNSAKPKIKHDPNAESARAVFGKEK